MHSSNSIDDVNLSNPLLQSLTDLRSHCVSYQCHLIDLILQNSKNRTHQNKDMIAISDVLQDKMALAGKLKIELHEGKWLIAETDFVKQLTADDIIIINQKLLSKRKFSEAEIRQTLQDLLITKFDNALLKTIDKQDTQLKQYYFLFAMRTQLDKCIEKHDSTMIKDQLNELHHVIQSNKALFSESRRMSFFQSSLPPELKNIIHEANELLKSQKPLLNIHHRTP